MSDGIASGQTEIVGSDEDLAVFNENAADGAFSEFDGLLGFLYGFEHKPFLVAGRLEVRI